ncbi:hypothetical protein [[Clostridium] fimetarium]|uniref:ABC-2 family transporter protein n=1 Tax=[Clostridium] fimetarium TaxID=99656 RepID=A0A1I0P7X7_9FIRM|nr:hypothetical protein [[Clostridium] fimetarium]SEW10386.1 hypothetical protein SAMN05421659_104234 [[Clostridium] fimetarium]
MKEFWKIGKISSFEKVDLKGLGRWLLAAIILGGFASRMNMHTTDDFVNEGMSTGFMPFMICFGLYGVVYNTLTNMPRFTRELPYTSRQEINMRIFGFVKYMITIAVFFVIYITFFGFLSGGYTDIHINTGYAIRYIVFSFFYYLFMTALMFPLGIIRDKKKWYITFASIAIMMATISLVFINLLPGKGGFRTSGNVFENISMIANCDVVLCIMGIITVATLIGSYILTQKRYAPKRYE